MATKSYLDVCDLMHQWPLEEKYELGSQARRSSNSAASQLAEKNDDRHIRNKIEGVNRSRGEAAETIHHQNMAYLMNSTLKDGPYPRIEVSALAVPDTRHLTPDT